MTMKVVGVIVLIFVVVAGLILSGNAGDWVDGSLNQVYKSKLPDVSDEARHLHNPLFIVDLHADTMLWNRDLLRRSNLGHVDLPRLKEGNVALQVFAVVTKTVGGGPAPPKARLIERGATKCLSAEEINQTGWLQVAQARPLSVWFDLKERALYQANRLTNFVGDSKGRLRVVTDVEDLRGLVRERVSGESSTIGALIALEGAHWLGEGDQTADDVKRGVAKLGKANFRMLAPTHRFNNALGASSEGCDQRAGFTDKGRAFIEAVSESNIILDVAHATDTGIAEAAEASKTPVVVSHTGMREHCCPPSPCLAPICDVARNMRDEEVRAIARTGGIVGVGIWTAAAGGSMEDVVSAFIAAHSALSEPGFVDEMRARNPNYDPFDHIALGSDFDGAVSTPIDVAGLPYLTQALIDRRQPNGNRVFDDNAIRKIFGVNACRVFATRLPGGGPVKADEICAPLMSGIASPATANPTQ